MQATRDLTQALYVAAVALGRTRDAEEVVRAAIAETQRAAGVEAVALHLLDAGRNQILGVLRAREEEARRIAHALHDEASQLLASVHIAVDSLIRQIPEGAGTLQEVHALLDPVEAQLRRLSRELRPTILDDLGLAPALEWLAQGVAERAGISVTVEAPSDRPPRWRRHSTGSCKRDSRMWRATPGHQGANRGAQEGLRPFSG